MDQSYRGAVPRRGHAALLRRWSLPGAWVLASCVLLAAVPARAQVTFLSPEAGSLLAGPTTIAFTVAPHNPPVERVDVYVRGRLVGTATAPGWSFEWNAPTDAAGATIVAAVYAGGALAGKVELPTHEVGFLDSVDVTMVQLYPVVTDRRGRYVRGLAAGDFSVLDQGKPVKIESFQEEASTLTVALVIDVSGSMEDKLAVVKEASARFVGLLGEYDAVALYAFSNGVRRVEPPTPERAGILAGIESLRAGGGTALHDALVKVLGDLKSVSGRKVIFVYSDGLDNRSLASQEFAVQTARASDVIIYAVGAGDEVKDASGREDLVRIAEETGGTAYFIEQTRDLPGVYRAFLADLRAQYVLAYTPPSGKAGVRPVEVHVANEKLSVRCRKTYYHQGG